MSGKPLLHLVFGGEVSDPTGTDFVEPDNLHIVGIFPDYKSALIAWRGASQAQVDNARYKYVIVHLHRLLEPGGAKKGWSGRFAAVVARGFRYQLLTVQVTARVASRARVLKTFHLGAAELLAVFRRRVGFRRFGAGFAVLVQVDDICAQGFSSRHVTEF